MTTHAFGMYGMFGPAADPFNFANFCQRVKALGIDIQGSPYRDYDTATIAAAIKQLPASDEIFVFGASLGANNSPVVAALVAPRRVSIWGFQASVWGAQYPVPKNVSFAHEAYNPNFAETLGLGFYEWTKGPGFDGKMVLTANSDLHPGDYDIAVQNMFLDDMKRIMAS